MKIICPNCSAEYQIDVTSFDGEGRNVQCNQCTQEWYEYNFFKGETEYNSDQTTLKKLALEEYQILKTSDTRTNKIKTSSQVTNDIKVRIQESSDKLEQTKKFTLNKHDKASVKPTRPNAWTVTGFVSASILYVFFSSFYIFNFELQKMLPMFQNSLIVYKTFIDQFFTIVQKIYSDSLKNLF